MEEEERDTIPRLHRIVDHAADQLKGFAEGGNTFEDCRVQYGRTQQRLQREGRGRITATRQGIPESERNWHPTVECLSELMRWGAIRQAPLPSARSFVERYRGHKYELTARGRELARLAEHGGTGFVDSVSGALISAHPDLRKLLFTLEEAPVVCPAVSEGDIERGRYTGMGTVGWGAWGAERIGTGTSAAAVAKQLETHLHRRFGNPPPEVPTNKALQEATNDAFSVAGFAARGLHLDATTIKTMLRWGSELLIFDQSRYVPRYPDCNVIWLAADLERTHDQSIRPVRRGMSRYGRRVAEAIVRAYDEQAASSDSSLRSPYLPIHCVRGQAAMESGVTRALVDIVLGRLADGEYPGVGASVLLHIGTTSLPGSEPAFRHHGRRRLEMTMSTYSVKE